MIHILGIRHHGPGSARNVKLFLEELKPDIVLIEGPVEADEILQWANHAELKPPVAILAYQPDNPQQSVFYPFAEFSPEWQAIQYARKNNIPVRFMDLPVAHHVAIEEERKKEKQAATGNNAEEQKADAVEQYRYLRNAAGEVTNAEETAEPVVQVRRDPVSYLAEAAGYDDGEKWWEEMFEHRLNNEQVFDAVAEAMAVLREVYPRKDDYIESLREAYMRKIIRQAEKELYTTMAVICGAWHAPALQNMPRQKEDNDLLKGLPKVKIECTWVPWTYQRLSYASGYGAGIVSPGWYEHVWHYPHDDGSRWMAKVAKLFREKSMDTSVAHVMEAVRLANSLASLRNISKAGLVELNEGALTVLCNGEPVLLELIRKELIVSDKIGEVPNDIPKPPLQVDIEKQQKKLRLPATADWKDYTLDLRKETDLERSIFLHRLLLIGIKWGEQSTITGKGTFKEQWRLQWQPELAVDIIEKGVWGNTVEEVANNFVAHYAMQSPTLSAVCGLLEQAIPAVLPSAIEVLIQQINNLSAASGDVIQLMEVIPGLVNVSRYGNVRKTDSEMVLSIVRTMIIRVCVSLPAACTAVNDDAAEHLMELFFKLNDGVSILQEEESTAQWQQTLQAVAANKNTAAVIAGYATRLLSDRKLLAGEELVNTFSYAMSSATAPATAAAWLEGFLTGSGTILLVDNDLWNVVNNWVAQLDGDMFTQLLPLLRRTFAGFSQPERRKLGEKVKHGTGTTGRATITETAFDYERAKKGLPVILQLLNIQPLQKQN